MSTREKSAVMEVLNLSAGYGQNILFENLDLHIHQGGLICFMGPNGVGKSTLIKTLGGLLAPLAGTIVFNSGSILKEQLISLVLTDPIRAAHMTVYDLIVFGRYPYLDWRLSLTPHDKELIERAIGLVRIDHLRNATIDKLSDGQKQMAMIARALAQDTPVIILDEPTAHLDLNNRVEIMRLLKDLTRSMNKAILLATHELDLALQTADIIWLTGNRKNIITGIPEDLVMQGVFDEIFQFKGFDLKTGKVQHEIFRRLSIDLEGNGHPYLWTRNLLERNGFAVSPSGACRVEIRESGGDVRWVVDNRITFDNLVELLSHIKGAD
jgi:iron complex transport system ATP-binding protein